MAHLNLGKSHATVSLHISNGGRFNPKSGEFLKGQSTGNTALKYSFKGSLTWGIGSWA
jgi:hypothetical protein